MKILCKSLSVSVTNIALIITGYSVYKRRFVKIIRICATKQNGFCPIIWQGLQIALMLGAVKEMNKHLKRN